MKLQWVQNFFLNNKNHNYSLMKILYILFFDCYLLQIEMRVYLLSSDHDRFQPCNHAIILYTINVVSCWDQWMFVYKSLSNITYRPKLIISQNDFNDITYSWVWQRIFTPLVIRTYDFILRWWRNRDENPSYLDPTPPA